jgi:hypothetical protein
MSTEDKDVPAEDVQAEDVQAEDDTEAVTVPVDPFFAGFPGQAYQRLIENRANW